MHARNALEVERDPPKALGLVFRCGCVWCAWGGPVSVPGVVLLPPTNGSPTAGGGRGTYGGGPNEKKKRAGQQRLALHPPYYHRQQKGGGQHGNGIRPCVFVPLSFFLSFGNGNGLRIRMLRSLSPPPSAPGRTTFHEVHTRKGRTNNAKETKKGELEPLCFFPFMYTDGMPPPPPPPQPNQSTNHPLLYNPPPTHTHADYFFFFSPTDPPTFLVFVRRVRRACGMPLALLVETAPSSCPGSSSSRLLV